MTRSLATVTFIAGSAVRLGSRHHLLGYRALSAKGTSRQTSNPRRRARFVNTATPPITTPPSTMMDRAVLDTDYVAPVLRPEQGSSVSVTSGPKLSEIASDLLIIAVRSVPEKEEWSLPKDVVAFDKDGAIAEMAADAEFVGKAGSSTDTLRIAGASAKRVVLYGIGDCGASAAAAKAAAFAITKGKAISSCTSVALYLQDGFEGAVAGAAEGANVAAYIDERFKGVPNGENGNKKKPTPPNEIVLVGASGDLSADVSRGQAIAAGIIAAKEVVTAPANSLTPEGLADAAHLVAREAGLEIKVLGRDECKKLGMGCYLGVTQGSLREPQFIHLTYSPSGETKKKVALVGKAVTFDSGGYNLKAGAGSMIELMKWDMGGSGAVLGAAAAIGRVKPADVEVHFIMPACENMISDRAIHPGDILTASNGKTVEVLNTDAEGRLCLADALVYAEKLNVDTILDIATLTGSIIVSLGNDVAGFWTPSDELADDLVTAGKVGDEHLWRMPLVQGYAEQLKSKIADLRNIGVGRAGSSITAALFLKEFVSLEKWSHIDIAGTAWGEKKGGATAFGVKTLLNYVESAGAKA